MTDLVKAVVREPGIESAAAYGRRVHRLAGTYLVLFFVPLIGIALLVWQAKLFVTLAQRSNVETLTLLFLLIFFAYVILLSWGGALGAARIAWYWLRARTGDRGSVERAKHDALGPPSGDPPVVAMNVVVERTDRPGEPFEIEVRDDVGTLGTLVVDGARVTHQEAHREGSNDLLAYFVHRVGDIVARRGEQRRLEIVQWKKVDDEATEEYVCLVEFARNLEQRLPGEGPLWPKVTVTPADCEELQRQLAAICPHLRDEAFLPDWEYTGEHKLPLVPEPLGLVSLSRVERRADPAATMGCASIVVVVATIIVAVFVLFPPWVPGT